MSSSVITSKIRTLNPTLFGIIGSGAFLVCASWIPSRTVQIISCLLAMTTCIFSFQALNSLKSAQYSILWGALSFIFAAFSFYPSPLTVFSKVITIWPLWAGGIIGSLIAWKVKMIHLPQLMAFFHSLVGLATSLLTLSLWVLHVQCSKTLPIHTLIELGLGGIMAAITFTGSVLAGLKLHGWLNQFQGRRHVDYLLTILLGSGLLILSLSFMIWPSLWTIGLLLLTAGVGGISLVLPIGGADMPVVISLLNSCSGWAALGVGFSLHHPLFIVVGAIVGFSGAVLSYAMCKGMNRSLKDVLWSPPKTTSQSVSDKPTKSLSPADAAFLLASARSIIVIPGYGMAAAQAQHILRELMDELKNKGATVRYAIHPVAGRMPGHMNVLLAEAHINYDDIYELEDINSDFATTDVVLVIGANDIVNSLAKTDPTSSIYGMPIFNVDKARTVLFIKRSLSAGYAGLDNPQFYEDNSFMIFGDAKKVCEAMIKALP